MMTSIPLPFYVLSPRGELLLPSELEQDSGLQIAQFEALLMVRNASTWRRK